MTFYSSCIIYFEIYSFLQEFLSEESRDYGPDFSIRFLREKGQVESCSSLGEVQTSCIRQI